MRIRKSGWIVMFALMLALCAAVPALADQAPLTMQDIVAANAPSVLFANYGTVLGNTVSTEPGEAPVTGFLCPEYYCESVVADMLGDAYGYIFYVDGVNDALLLPVAGGEPLLRYNWYLMSPEQAQILNPARDNPFLDTEMTSREQIQNVATDPMTGLTAVTTVPAPQDDFAGESFVYLIAPDTKIVQRIDVLSRQTGKLLRSTVFTFGAPAPEPALTSRSVISSFRSGTRTGGKTIVVQSADGTQPEYRITLGRDDTAIAVCPDGYVVSTDAAGRNPLYLIDADCPSVLYLCRAA